MGFDDFLENDCWPEVRELFKEARRLAVEKGFKVRKGGKGAKGSPGIRRNLRCSLCYRGSKTLSRLSLRDFRHPMRYSSVSTNS